MKSPLPQILFAPEGSEGGVPASSSAGATSEKEDASPAASSPPPPESAAGAGSDTQAGSETPPTTPPASDWQMKRIQELSGQRAKNQQRIQELEAALAAQQAKATPAGKDGRTYTQEEFDAAVRANAAQLADFTAFDEKCNNIVNAGRAAHPDFNAKLDVLKAAAPLVREFVEQAAAVGDAHEIIYALGANPALGQDIMGMSAAQRAVALVKLQGEIKSKSNGKAAVSSAPAPPESRVGAQSSGEKSLENIQDMSSWIAERNRQLDEKRKSVRK